MTLNIVPTKMRARNIKTQEWETLMGFIQPLDWSVFYTKHDSFIGAVIVNLDDYNSFEAV